MCPMLVRLPVLLFALAMPMAGCAGNDKPAHGASTHAAPKPAHSGIEDSPADCDGISSLPDKRACYGRQDQASIDECERIRPMRCKPYREMDGVEKRLAAIEKASVVAARKAYASYVEGDAAYLTDLDNAASEESRAWRAYREAHCTLEPFAQGMSRNGAEDLIEACRARMTQARIDELKALYSPVNVTETQP